MNGKAVEVIARFDEKSPIAEATVTAGGIPRGAIGGIIGIPPAPPSPQKKAAGAPIVPIDAKEMESQLVTKVEPIYPAFARQNHIQGVVSLSIVVNEEGKVESIQKISGDSLLTPAAIDAVKQWVYKPSQLAGKPVKVRTNVDITFALDGAGK